MATNTFKNSAVTGIGTSNTTVYTTATGKKSMVLQFDVVNTTASTPINVDVFVYNSALAANVFLFKNVPVAAGYPLEVLPSNKKLVLAAGDYIGVKSSIASSANAILSVLEDVA